MTRSGLALAFRKSLVAIGLSLAGLALLGAWLFDLAFQILNLARFWMDDARSYAAGGHHFIAGLPVYAPFQLAGPYGLGDAAWGQGFVYPPTAALLFAPLGMLDLTGLGLVFTAALGLLGILAYRVAIDAGLPRKPAILVALIVTISGPAVNAWDSGNVNLLVADALLASWLWPLSSGYLAVIGGMVKMFPGAGLVWTLRKGGPIWRPILLGLGIVALSTLVVGPAGWHDFLAAFANGRSMSWYWIPSPTTALGPGVGTVVGYGLAAVALAGVWRIRDERLAFALLGLAMILPAPDWWSHYLIMPITAGLPWVCTRLASIAGRMSQSRAGVLGMASSDHVVVHA